MDLGDDKEEGVEGHSQGSDLYNCLDDDGGLKRTSWKRPAVKGSDRHPRRPLHGRKAHGEAWAALGTCESLQGYVWPEQGKAALAGWLEGCLPFRP